MSGRKLKTQDAKAGLLALTSSRESDQIVLELDGWQQIHCRITTQGSFLATTPLRPPAVCSKSNERLKHNSHCRCNLCKADDESSESRKILRHRANWIPTLPHNAQDFQWQLEVCGLSRMLSSPTPSVVYPFSGTHSVGPGCRSHTSAVRIRRVTKSDAIRANKIY